MSPSRRSVRFIGFIRLPRAALSAAVLVLIFSGHAAAQQPAPANAPPAACLGYAYSIRPTPVVPGGLQTVTEVLPGTPAEAGGLRAGDVLVSVHGVLVGSAPQPQLTPGATIRFVVLRNRQNVTLRMVVGQRVPGAPGEMVCRPVTTPTGSR